MKRLEQFELHRRLIMAVGMCACLSASTALAQVEVSPPEPASAEAPATPGGPAVASPATAPAEARPPASPVTPKEAKPAVAAIVAAPKADPKVPPAPAAKEPTSVAVTRPGTFEIHVRGDDLRGVLQLLSVQGNRNIVCTKEIQGTVTVDLYGVTFEQALDAVMASSGFDYIEQNGSIYVYTQDRKAALLKAKIKPITKAFKLSYIPAADAQVLVAPALSAVGKIVVSLPSAVGIAPNKTDAGGNSFPNSDTLVVSDVPEALDRVAKLLEEIDVKPDQVLIEATILSAKLTEGNQLGVNFNFLGGVDFSDTGATWNTSGKPTYTPGNVVDRSGVNFRTDFPTFSNGVTLGIFGNDIAFFISALETVTDVTVIANPKLMVINKQRGEVLVGKRDGYKTSTMTGTNTIETVEFLETGVKLYVRPFVAKDKYIRLEIHPEDSDGGVAANGQISSTSTEVTSNILIKDGHTIVIGGLFRENTTTAKNQVPVLGNIPYLGTLFRTNNDSTERNEVIILITPHIISNEADEAVSRQMRDDAERIHMGARKGSQWWSSERLAMCYIRSAKQALREGKREQAMWDLDMALAIRPRLFEAISLKEQVTRKAYWADEVQNAPTRYVVERMIMQELGKCYTTVIPPNRPLNAERIPEDVRRALGIQPTICPPAPQPLTGQVEQSNVKVEIQVPTSAKPPVEAPQPKPAEDKPAQSRVTEPPPAATAQEPAAQATTQPAEDQTVQAEPEEPEPADNKTTEDDADVADGENAMAD